jgi:predicted nuclease of predicted toxin-antitoxin system
VGVGKKVETWIKNKKYNAKIIRDIDPRMSDLDILNIAVSEKRLVITMDKDFGELVYKCRWPHSGVLLLRLEDERAEEKIKVIETILENYSSEIIFKFSVFKDKKLRIRE